MPYVVFALKWRPKNFDEVIGQEHIVSTLKNSLVKNRLAHAYLFCGPRGVGKTSLARILAKSLNCKNGPTLTPCQVCPACVEIAQSRSMDVIEIDGASNRGIDEIRTLRENVKFSPVSGKFKIYIIDEVHMLTPEAFNALLKTLEEPPEFVKFIFATTHPHKVIPTILSRCHRFDFRRIPVMEIIAQLEKIVKEENIAIDKEVLFAIAKSSDGSLRDAESILDQLVSFAKEKVTLKDVISVLGVVEQDALFEITDKIIQKDALAALELFNKIIDEGKDTGVFLSYLIEHFRNLMVAKISRADSRLIDLPQDICERLLKQADAFTLDEIFSTFNVMVNTQETAKRMDSVRIPLEISLVKLAQEKKDSGLKAPVKEARNDPPQTDDPPANNESAAISVTLDEIRNNWQNLIERLKFVKISVATYLNEGNPEKLAGSALTISFAKDSSLHKESLERKENKAIIEKAIAELLNCQLRINFILSKEDAKKQEEQDENNPMIKSVLDAFGGKIVRKS